MLMKNTLNGDQFNFKTLVLKGANQVQTVAFSIFSSQGYSCVHSCVPQHIVYNTSSLVTTVLYLQMRASY